MGSQGQPRGKLETCPDSTPQNKEAGSTQDRPKTKKAGAPDQVREKRQETLLPRNPLPK